nr:carboxypeptidase-like regulatory domain-containing protein [Planctomycetota bacterium]
MQSKRLVIVWMVVACVALASSLWIAFGGSDDSPDLAIPTSADAREDTTQDFGAPHSVVLAKDVRDRTEAAAVPRPLATLRGRCVDTRGQPIAGCRVSLHGGTASLARLDAWLEQHPAKPEWKAPLVFTTGDDGRFSFEFWPPPPFEFTVEVEGEGFHALRARWPTLAEAEVQDLGDIVMQIGVQLHGRVVDTDGTPQPKVPLVLLRLNVQTAEGALHPPFQVPITMRADASFVSRDVMAPGTYEVRTGGYELQAPKSVVLRANDGSVEVLVTVAKLLAVKSIRGRILDIAGTPAPGVSIESRSDNGQQAYAQTRGDGSFELTETQPGGAKVTTLSIRDDSYDAASLTPRELAWGTMDAECRVAPSSTLTLRITDPRGQPVPAYSVRMIPRGDVWPTSQDLRVRAQGQHENGTVVLHGFAQGTWQVIVDFPPSSELEAIVEDFQQEITAPRRLDLRAMSSARRMLRVLDSDGTAVVGTKVQLCETFGKPMLDASTLRSVVDRDTWLINNAARR